MVREKRFGFMLKTYAHDYNYVKNLMGSYNKFNKEKLPLFIVCPRIDEEIFAQFTNENIHVITEDTFINLPLFDSDATDKSTKDFVSDGYINQQIFKIYFAMLDKLDVYVSIDSDFEFVTEFRRSDFLPTLESLYFVGHNNEKEFWDREYFEVQGRERMKSLTKIASTLKSESRMLYTIHTGALIYSHIALELLNSLKELGLDIVAALRISPYEYNWYTYYIQIAYPEAIRIDPFILVVHSRRQLGFLVLQGCSKEDIARSYIGICVNSNISKKSPSKPIHFDTFSPYSIGELLPLKPLLRALIGGVMARFLLLIRRNKSH